MLTCKRKGSKSHCHEQKIHIKSLNFVLWLLLCVIEEVIAFGLLSSPVEHTQETLLVSRSAFFAGSLLHGGVAAARSGGEHRIVTSLLT